MADMNYDDLFNDEDIMKLKEMIYQIIDRQFIYFLVVKLLNETEIDNVFELTAYVGKIAGIDNDLILETIQEIKDSIKQIKEEGLLGAIEKIKDHLNETK